MPRRTLEQRVEQARLRNELAEQAIRAQRLALMGQHIAAVTRPSSRYDNATRTRLRPGPRAQGGSAQSHLTKGRAQTLLRRDAQDLARNSTVARMLLRRVAQMLVGDGAVCTSTTPNPGWNTIFDDRFRRWADATSPDTLGHCDIRREKSLWELLACAVMSWGTDGDELWLLTKGGQVQVIEGERIVSPGWAPATALDGGGSIVEGVELDRYGAHAGYHVADWDIHGAIRAERDAVRRVGAGYARLLTCPIGMRTGLIRGEPFLQAVIDRIERLDKYEESTAIAAEIATLFAALVKSENPAQLQADMEGATSDQPDSPVRDVSIEPGSIQYLEHAGDITQIKPEFPTTNFREYVQHQLIMMGAELGLPLVSVCFEATQLSWSNIKALYALSQRCLEPAQASLARTIRWVRAFKARQWMLEGSIPSIDDYERCEVVLPQAPVVDFKSEVEGYALAIEKNLMTQDDATQRLGTGRAADIRAARQAEREDEIARGIVPPVTPGSAPVGAGGGNTKADDDKGDA